jgi:hypothetical protein
VTKAHDADDNGHRHAYGKRERDARRTVDDQRNRPETCKYHDNARHRATEETGKSGDEQGQRRQELGGRERRRHERKNGCGRQRHEHSGYEPGLGRDAFTGHD